MIKVFGSINLDLIAKLPRLPQAGETLSGTDFKTAPGGKGGNQALAARKAGADVAMIGAVGRDAHGDEALALLRYFGVDCDAIAPTDQPTGTALILVGDDTGDNMIAVIPGANGLAQADALHLAQEDVLLLQLEVPLPQVKNALDQAAAAGARSILNIAPWQADAALLLAHCDILVANETEFDLASAALALEGDDRQERMADYVAKYGHMVIVTLGEKGAVAMGQAFSLAVPSLTIKAIDTVGAGDTFCGYLAALLSEGANIEQALLAASAAGALACTKHGAQPSIPLRAEVEAAL